MLDRYEIEMNNEVKVMITFHNFYGNIDLLRTGSAWRGRCDKVSVIIVAADALVLKHQAITSHNNYQI